MRQPKSEYDEDGSITEKSLLWFAIMAEAVRDSRALPDSAFSPIDGFTEEFVETLFMLPGFVLTAHIRVDVLYCYLRVLIRSYWDDHGQHTSESVREKAGLALMAKFRDRHCLPMVPAPDIQTLIAELENYKG